MRLAIPSSDPIFEGHFPGRPILPAVALLDRAVRAIAAAGAPADAGPPPALLGIAQARWRHPVAPGDLLEMETPAPDPGGRVRFALRRAADLVADGVLLFGAPRPPAVAAPGPGPGAPEVATPVIATPTAATPPLDDLLPHRPPMRMVEAIEEESEDGLACRARVDAGCAFGSGGSAPALVAIEMAAQAAALFEALRRRRAGGAPGARIGYLVGARDVQFACGRLPVGAPCRAAIRLAAVALPLSNYRFEVAVGGGVAAAGTLSTWITTTAA